jgi:hypothetical protein
MILLRPRGIVIMTAAVLGSASACDRGGSPTGNAGETRPRRRRTRMNVKRAEKRMGDTMKRVLAVCGVLVMCVVVSSCSSDSKSTSRPTARPLTTRISGTVVDAQTGMPLSRRDFDGFKPSSGDRRR